MRLKACVPLSSILLLLLLLRFGEGQLQDSHYTRSSDIAKLSSALTKSEPRQMGLLGFTALGAMMFPILVSLGMASFVSHLPTVFKEFASEFGIPATPPRRFFFFGRQRKAYDDRWDNILRRSLPQIIKTLEDRQNVQLSTVQIY